MTKDRHSEEREIGIDGACSITKQTPRNQSEKLRALFPNLLEPQLEEVAETLHEYCAIVWRIYDRLQREDPAVIDELMRNRRIKGKVDSSN